MLVIFLLVKNMHAQDPIFTQAFMIPETMNTGFTGSTESTTAGMVHRVQWPGLDFSINTQFAFVDTWLDELNSGVGISILNHKETKTRYTFTQVNFNYAIAVRLSENWYFRPSISIGAGMKSSGFQNLILEDQINIFDGTIDINTIDPALLTSQIKFFDFSSSLLFNNEASWVGITLRHLNKPNVSMTHEGNNALDMFLSVHSAIEIPFSIFPIFRNIDEEHKVYFLSNFMKQGQYTRLDIGSQYVYDRFSVGLLAAIDPEKRNLDTHLLTSINAFIGFKKEGWKFSYSQDFSTNSIGKTGGVYEITVSYNFENEGFRRLRCPKLF
jgi:type IX secretion system PorP/SprF family membrane protein